MREADWVAAHEDGAEAWLLDPENLLRYVRDSGRAYDLSGTSSTERQHWLRPSRHDSAPILLTNAGQHQLWFIVNFAFFSPEEPRADILGIDGL